MAYTYTRTITTSPEGALYTWNNPASSWITITQQGTSDSWNIEILDNTGDARSATLTVTHEDGVTSDSISVSQAGATVNPTATPTATPVPPTQTPTATAPSSTFAMTSNTTSIQAANITNASNTSPVTVTYQLTVPSGQSPVTPTIDSPPDLINPGGFTVNSPTLDEFGLAFDGYATWTGNISVWPAMSVVTTLLEEVVVSWGGQSSSFYIVANGATLDPDDDGDVRFDG
jgi:hypothetical protein